MAAQPELWSSVHRLVEAAAKGRQIVWGKQLMPNPEFFIVGDEPLEQDLVVGVPFSGSLGPVLVNALEALFRKYGADAKAYVTYLVKARYKPGELTEEMVFNEWLPALQAEYQATGCSAIVAVGSVAKMVQGHIGMKNPALAASRPPFIERIKQAWRLLKS